MSEGFELVVCGGPVPDPLQTLEPTTGPDGPAIRNEMMLPAVLDPWAAHALYEAFALAAATPGSRVRLVALGPKAKLQQLMMTVAQKAPFELTAIDGPSRGFVEPSEVAAALADAILKIPELDRDRLLLFGGCASASRDAGVTMPLIGERLGIARMFTAVDELTVQPDGSLRLLERVEGGRYQISTCPGPPAVVTWATGRRPEPPGSPQVGMQNMRGIMQALAGATTASAGSGGVEFLSVELPTVRRQTRVVKDASVDEIAAEIVAWIRS